MQNINIKQLIGGVVLLFAGILYSVHEPSMKSLFLYFFAYLAILSIAYVFRKTVIGKLLHLIVSIPAAFILYTGRYAVAIGTPLFACGMIYMLSVYAFGIIPNNLLDIPINDTTTIYLSLTFSSIIMTSFGDKLVGFWHYVQSHDEHDDLTGLSVKLLDQSKIRYVLFVCYFILLLIVNFCVLNQIALFNMPKLDIAIVQAFATYVAYDRLVSNWNAIIHKK